MNPWHLNASELMIWGLVAHLIAEWPLQNEWMALNKMHRRLHPNKHGVLMTGYWWDRHPSAYVHAFAHISWLSLVFGWVAVPLGILHLIIDCRWPVAKWSKFIGQTQPQGILGMKELGIGDDKEFHVVPVVDIGLEVRFWNDQVFHIICIAVAALVVGSV